MDLAPQLVPQEAELRDCFARVLASRRFILGPEVEALEQEIAAYSAVEHGIGVSSGTDALLVSLMALGVGPGDEVITTPYSFFATAGVIWRLGARPVFVDIDPDTWNIDPEKLEAALSDKTSAIIPVHLFGQCGEMDDIADVCRKRGLPIVEDAAQAVGAELGGKRAGAWGDLTCLSFFPSKNLGALGDGGMVLSNDRALAERVKVLRAHGGKPKYYHREVGGNFRLDALQAALLRVRLPRLDGWTEQRQANADLYDRLLGSAELAGKVERPKRTAGSRHIFNQYVIKAEDRDRLHQHLGENGVGSAIYYPVPLHLQECFATLGYEKGRFPVAEKAAGNTLALPVYPGLTRGQVEYVVETVRGFYGGAAAR